MDIYLPIAEMPVNVIVLLAMGGAVGFISGMFGVGGGFLLTPLLIFSGIPPAYAIASVTPQIVASSASGALSYARRGGVDFQLAAVLIASGGGGAVVGAFLFAALGTSGQLQVVIAICYTVFLATIGALMVNESVRAILRRKTEQAVGVAAAPPPTRRSRAVALVSRLPLKMRFRQSKLYISAIPPFLVGLCVGVLAAIMGVGGGFIMVPAMIYLLHMPTKVVVGTSLFQIIFVTGFTTLLHATTNFTVDMVLAVLLLIGGVVGAQIGTQIGARLKAEQLRILLALMVLAVCGKLALDLLLQPAELCSVGASEGH